MSMITESGMGGGIFLRVEHDSQTCKRLGEVDSIA
jgi:hypothetical protein